MNEADEHPSGDEARLPGNNLIEKSEIAALLSRQFRVVAVDRIVSQCFDALDIAARGEKLKRADANVACRDPRQHPAGKRGFPIHRITGQHGGQRAGRRDAERRHGLAHNIFAQHRPKRRAPIAAPREGRRA